MATDNTPCVHIRAADKSTKETSSVCRECIKENLHWVQLRVCLACGNVGCCDSSVGRHAKKHFESSQHPIMAEYPGRSWLWCYIDKQYG